MVQFGEVQLNPDSRSPRLANTKPFDRIDLPESTPRNINHSAVRTIVEGVRERYPGGSVRAVIGMAQVALEITPPTYGQNFLERRTEVFDLANKILDETAPSA